MNQLIKWKKKILLTNIIYLSKIFLNPTWRFFDFIGGLFEALNELFF